MKPTIASLPFPINRLLNPQSRLCCGWSIARLYYYFCSVRPMELLGRCHQDINKIGPGSVVDLWRVTSWKITAIRRRPSSGATTKERLLKLLLLSVKDNYRTGQVRQRFLPACNFLATINFNFPLACSLFWFFFLPRPRSHPHRRP